MKAGFGVMLSCLLACLLVVVVVVAAAAAVASACVACTHILKMHARADEKCAATLMCASQNYIVIKIRRRRRGEERRGSR